LLISGRWDDSGAPLNTHRDTARPGEDTVVLPFLSDEEAENLFARGGGVRRVRSYLRYVRDPSLRLL
jgi:hypothetical protein